MGTLVKDKIIHIITRENDIFGISENGDLYVFSLKTRSWEFLGKSPNLTIRN